MTETSKTTGEIGRMIVAEEAYLNAVRDVLAFQKMEAELHETRTTMLDAARRAVELFGSDPMGVLDRLDPPLEAKEPVEDDRPAVELPERKRRTHVTDDEFQRWAMEAGAGGRIVTVQQAMDQFGISTSTGYRKLCDLRKSGLAVLLTELHSRPTEQHEFRMTPPAPNGPSDPRLLQPARTSQPAAPVAGTGKRERWSSVSEINEILWALPREEAIIQRTGMDHISVQNRRTGKKVTMSQTPRSTNTQKIKADLRSIGFSIDS